MTIRRVMGTSGGFIARDRWDVMQPGGTVLRMLELTKKERPRLCFIHTASGDNAGYLARSYEAMTDSGCDVTHLQLFTQPNLPLREHILKSDAIWVGVVQLPTFLRSGNCTRSTSHFVKPTKMASSWEE